MGRELAACSSFLPPSLRSSSPKSRLVPRSQIPLVCGRGGRSSLWGTGGTGGHGAGGTGGCGAGGTGRWQRGHGAGDNGGHGTGGSGSR